MSGLLPHAADCSRLPGLCKHHVCGATWTLISGSTLSVAPGYKLDGPAFHTLFNAYNPERNGTMDLTEFIAMTLFLQSANATFTAFDQQRMGRVTLDYNQFIYAAANIV